MNSWTKSMKLITMSKYHKGQLLLLQKVTINYYYGKWQLRLHPGVEGKWKLYKPGNKWKCAIENTRGCGSMFPLFFSPRWVEQLTTWTEYKCCILKMGNGQCCKILHVSRLQLNGASCVNELLLTHTEREDSCCWILTWSNWWVKQNISFSFNICSHSYETFEFPPCCCWFSLH